MKKIFNLISCAALLCVAIIGISFKLETKKVLSNKKKSAAFFDNPLPCGMTSRNLLATEDPSHYINTSNNGPILSASGSWFIPPLSGPLPVPTQFVNGTVKLVLQSDGNLVIYHNTTALWATNTVGSGGKYLFFQTSDGNLVLTQNPDRTGVVWASNIYTTCSGGNLTRMRLQTDGNLVVLYPQNPNFDYNLGDTGTGGFTQSSHYAIIN